MQYPLTHEVRAAAACRWRPGSGRSLHGPSGRSHRRLRTPAGFRSRWSIVSAAGLAIVWSRDPASAHPACSRPAGSERGRGPAPPAGRPPFPPGETSPAAPRTQPGRRPPDPEAGLRRSGAALRNGGKASGRWRGGRGTDAGGGARRGGGRPAGRGLCGSSYAGWATAGRATAGRATRVGRPRVERPRVERPGPDRRCRGSSRGAFPGDGRCLRTGARGAWWRGCPR